MFGGTLTAPPATMLAIDSATHSAWSNGLEGTTFDYFTRTDSANLGSTWTQTTGWKISSNQARNDWGFGSVAWKNIGYAGEEDNYSRIQLYRMVNNVGPVARGNGSTTNIYGYYVHRKAQDQWAISKIVNNARVELTSFIEAEYVGINMYISATGDQISASVGSYSTTITDTSITTGGYIGIYTAN